MQQWLNWFLRDPWAMANVNPSPSGDHNLGRKIRRHGDQAGGEFPASCGYIYRNSGITTANLVRVKLV